ncbi:MAG: hypothetical protein ACR2HR_13640 [Euzebya sp.]
MTTLTTPIAELPAEFRPLYRSEYDHLVGLGVFEGTRVELVGGVLVEMSPMNHGSPTDDDAHRGQALVHST